MKCLLPLCLAVTSLLASSSAQQAALDGKAEVKAALRSLFPYFAPQPPPGLENLFTAEFLRLVPEADLRKALQELHQKYGEPQQVRLLRMTGPFASDVELTFSKDVRVPVHLTVEDKPPHRIGGLLFKAAERSNDTWAVLAAEVKQIPGTVACSVHRLDNPPKPLLEVNAHTPLAVGSSFKLLVLATLAEEIGSGKLTWQDVLNTDKRWYSLPGGLLQDWPEHSPVTLFTLAALMISRSDNTAADHLLHHLGREKVQAMQRRFFTEAGSSRRHPHLNDPFLSTAELFKIKMKLPAQEQAVFADASPAERRKLLPTVVAPHTLEHPRHWTRPRHIDKIEWFYSTNDLCRIVDWLRRTKDVPHLKELLAIAQPFEVDEVFWQYVGFKGGAEVGVLNYTLLLQSRKETWYAVSVTWNHAERPNDEGKLKELIERIIRLLQKTEADRK